MFNKTRGAVGACLVAGIAALAAVPSMAGADPTDVKPNLCIAATGPVTGGATCINTDVSADPCLANPNLPGCVNDVFDRTIWGLETGRATYNDRVQPVADQGACGVYSILTGQPCPGLVPKL